MDVTTLGKTGLRSSAIGFGCAPLGDEYGSITDNEAVALVHQAIDLGITLFDTSPYYGRTLSESRLGKALKGKRDQVIVATKGGRFDAPLDTGFDFSFKSIMRMCEESLRRLQTDYLDIYQLHDIEFGRPEVVEEGVKALFELKKQGKVRFIGVTGFPVQLLKTMAEKHDFDVTLSYCHGNLLNDRIHEVLVPVVKKKEMGLLNASITHMGLLTPQGGQNWHPASEEIKQTAKAAADFCQSKGESIAELAIQFAFSQPNIDVTVLGPRTKQELERSIQLFHTEMDVDLLTAVQSILKPAHNQSWPSGHSLFWE